MTGLGIAKKALTRMRQRRDPGLMRYGQGPEFAFRNASSKAIYYSVSSTEFLVYFLMDKC